MATNRYIGNAANVARTYTVTFAKGGGADWAAADTATATVNTKALVVTMGSAVTTAALAGTAFKKAWNGTASAANEYTANFDASGHGEFAEMTATDDGAGVITLTGDTAGKEITVTSVTEVTAGTGTATLASVTAADGYNNWDSAKNWSSAAVCSDGDIVIFQRDSTSCLYGLSDTNMTPASLAIDAEYEGYIGLPRTNVDVTALPYSEYRTTELTIADAADATNVAVSIGEGTGDGSRRLNINFTDSQYTATVYRTGARLLDGVPPCLLYGSHASNSLNVLRGDVGVGIYATSATFATIRVGYITNQSTDAVLTCGANAGLSSCTLTQLGGTVYIESALSAAEILGGTLNTIGTGTLGTLQIGGTCNYRSTGTVTAADVRTGGVLNCNGNAGATITTLTLHPGFTVIDEEGLMTFTNLVFDECGFQDGVLRLGRDISDVDITYV